MSSLRRTLVLVMLLALVGQPIAAVPMIAGEAQGHAGPCCCKGDDHGAEPAESAVASPVRCSACPAPESDAPSGESPCQPNQCLRCCPSASPVALALTTGPSPVPPSRVLVAPDDRGASTFEPEVDVPPPRSL